MSSRFLHPDRRLPDERARQRVGRCRSCSRRATSWSIAPARPTHPVEYVQRPATRRGQDLQCPGPAETAQGATSRARSSACWAAWPRRTKQQIFDGPARRPGGRAGPVGPVAGLARTGGRRRRAADRSQPRPRNGSRQSVQRSFAQFVPTRPEKGTVPICAKPAPTSARPFRQMGTVPFGLAASAPGDGAGDVRLRQVLHLLHRAARARAGAEPPGRRNRRRSPPPGRRRLPGSDPAGPDGQQLQGHDRPDRRCVWPTCSTGCTTSRASGG